MAKTSQAVTLKRMINLRRKVVTCKKSKPNPIESPPVKIFLLGEEEIEDQVETQEGDFCQNWEFISFHRKYEEKIAELEKQLKEAKADTDFWYWKSEELESNLQNLHLQHHMTQNTRELENDDVTSQCSCTGPSETDKSQCSSDGQSGDDKWRCRICAENEARVVVRPCCHLCLCLDCAKETETCPVCDASKTGVFVVRTRY